MSVSFDLAGAKTRLGVLVLAQVIREIGEEAPDVEDAKVVKTFFEGTQRVREMSVLTYHDGADGGCPLRRWRWRLWEGRFEDPPRCFRRVREGSGGDGWNSGTRTPPAVLRFILPHGWGRSPRALDACNHYVCCYGGAAPPGLSGVLFLARTYFLVSDEGFKLAHFPL